MLKLLFFGRLEDAAGGSERNVAHQPTMRALLDSLESRLQEALRGPRIRSAVNGALTEAGEIPLAEGDEIAFFAPVSGG